MQNENPEISPVEPVPTDMPAKDQPAVPEQPKVSEIGDKPPKKKFLTRKKLIIIGIALVVLLTGAAAAYFLYFKKDEPVQSQPAQTEKPKSADAVATVKQCDTKNGTALKATWTGSRTKLTGVKFIKPPKAEEIDSEHPEKVKVDDYTSYYKIGTTDKNQAIILFSKGSGPLDLVDGIAIEKSAGQYAVLVKSSGNVLNTDGTKNIELLSNATFDETQFFPELCVLSLKYKNVELEDTYNGFGFSNSITDYDKATMTELAKYDSGTLYEYVFKQDANYRQSQFVLKRKDTLWQNLTPPDLLSFKSQDDYVPQITWTDGSANKSSYSTAFRGCGGGNSLEIGIKLTDKDLVKIGTDKNGTVIYGFVSADNALFQAHYKDYLEQYTKDYHGDRYDASKAKLSAANFLKLKPVIVMKDGLGRYIVMQDAQFYGGGGCGKPVVYLYPTRTTQVSVKVGANVLKSDPLYGSGWNVTARPDGTLTSNGKTYGSLFWEGIGHGIYPVINQGSVVKRDQVEATLRANLKQQGLNSKESAEFLDFWLPLMPNKPYVRISWLGTQDMNRLAPLNIAPAPQTVIRVFLDAEGLDKPVKLTSQKFAAPERKGFTVVEWGGLLDGKLQ